MNEQTNEEQSLNINIPIIQTICRDCVFKYDNTQSLDDETGASSWCVIGKLDNSNAEWNRDGQYWSLNYFCNHCRNEDWVKKNKLEYSSDQGLLEKIREENKVYSDIIILVHQNHLIEDIDRALNKIKSGHVGKIIISVNNTKIKPSLLNSILKKYTFDWQAIFHIDDLSIDEQIYKVHKYTKGMFFIVVDKLEHYRDDLPKLLDDMINDNGEKFIFYETDEGITNLVVHNILYKTTGTIKRDVIQKLAEENQCQHMLKLKN